MPQVVLVTGAGTGIGRVTAMLLARRGNRVFGTSRDPARVNVPGIEMVPMDVTSDESVASGARAVLERTGRIDVLVNNVGYVLLGSTEETTIAEFTEQLDTNFVGAVRVTGTVLPTMREQRRGKIVNISSLGGLSALPFTSAYSASKFALEGYSESLRQEMLPFGVYVSLVEPGNVRTETLDSSIRGSGFSHPAYAEVMQRVASDFKIAGRESKLLPETIANVVAKIVEQPAPRLRYPVGLRARLVPLLKVLLAQSTFEKTIRRQLRLDQNTLSMPRASRSPEPRPAEN